MFRHFTVKIAVVVAMGVAIVGIHSAQAVNNGGSVQGIVKSASGEAVSGAFVKLKNAERRLTFMVISQTQGSYQIGGLPPGKYRVQGIGGDFQSEWSAPVDVGAGKSSTANVWLRNLRGPMLSLAGPRAQQPQPGTPRIFPEGEGKRIAETKCAQCHDTQRVSGARYTREGWEDCIEVMRDYARAVTAATDLTDEEAKVLLDYVTTHFLGETPKADPNSRLPRTLLSGEATQYLAVEYEIPTHDSEPHEITVDKDGNGWVSERKGGLLGKLDVNTLAFTEVSPPPAAWGGLRLNAIAQGLGNSLWMVDGGPNRRWLSYDTKTGKFQVFPAPAVRIGSPGGNTMVVRPDGTVWLAILFANQVVGLNPATGKFVTYEVPSGVATGGRGASPYGMAIAGDGKVWFNEFAVNKMGRLVPDTGTIDEFDIPLQGCGNRKMGSDSDGNLWVGCYSAGKLLKIDYKTTQMTVFSPPTENSGVYAVSGDPKSKLIWFSEQRADKIARFDPQTQAYVEYPMISAESDVRRMEVDPNQPNRIWWAGHTSNLMGYIEILSGDARQKQ